MEILSNPSLWGAIALRLLACFALGSIPFAVVAMAGTGIDIRRVGSGNPGFNNVLRVSKLRAVVALVGDVGKGVLAIWLVWRVWPVSPESGIVLGWLFGFAAVLGHCYSPFLKFNGGKGIATSGGVMVILYPWLAAVAMAFFMAARLAGSYLKWSERGMIASLASWVLFTVMMFLLRGPTDGGLAAGMTLLLAWRHRKNFQNLISAFERREASA
jgi:acyl phosphate:glycerol-3-phosphate acyltransferase